MVKTKKQNKLLIERLNDINVEINQMLFYNELASDCLIQEKLQEMATKIKTFGYKDSPDENRVQNTLSEIIEEAMKIKKG